MIGSSPCDALEVEDEHEQQREAREAVDERRAGGGGEHAVLEDREVEHRRAPAALDQHERPAAAPRRRPAPPITTGSFQPEMPPLETPSTSPVSPATKTAVPSRSSPRTGSRLASSRRTSAPQSAPSEAERHVEPEDPVPRDRDQRAAEHRPEHEADRGDHRVRAHREAELLAREGVGDERGGVGEQERAADALEDPPQDQLACRRPRSRRRARRARRRRSRRRRPACGRTGRTGGRP